MPRGRTWTIEDKEYLQDKWGTVSAKSIAKRLGRSVDSVKQKAYKIGLGDARFNYDGISINQLAKAMNRCPHVLYRWIELHALPAKQKVFMSEARVWVIRYSDFWKWAEQHKTFINLAKMEANTLGPEPDWVREKRKADELASQKSKRSIAWKPEEEQRLLQLASLPNATYPEIACLLDRTESSIRRRLYDLNVKVRPRRIDSHIKYTQEDIVTMSRWPQQDTDMSRLHKRLERVQMAYAESWSE